MLKKRFMENKYRRMNILIALCTIIMILISSLFIIFNRTDTTKNEITGTIETFHHKEEKWWDFIFQFTPNLRIQLKDERQFEAFFAYEYIDPSLYSALVKNTEITIIYNKHNRILGIMYNNKTYLDDTTVLEAQIQNDKKIRIGATCMIILTMVASPICFYINNKKYKNFCKNYKPYTY